ncbi:hypothetical protein [Congzhengia minquanensis]|uniref:Uncharacterized protein n=1 Tax=Congzhengia minquanensis TaxID=2763657 RepID=A0A926HYQ1_9FIRM|nr:hypothetical protein [Congzhengia minquanensis]MBC8540633.1 hypothetical protein [Congzhengia minquanensis]
MKRSSITIELNMPKILNKVENDKFGKALAKEWAGLVKQFVPHNEGFLDGSMGGASVVIEPFLIHYNSDYAEFMYNGVVYVDPVYHCAGFTKDGGVTWKSRHDVKKIPSNRTFNYRKDKNSYATDHWDKAAENAGEKDKLINFANEYLRRKM